MEGTAISDNILVANVLVTKLVYNLTLSILLVYNIEIESRGIFDRKAKSYCSIYKKWKEEPIYYWTGILSILLFSYLIFDGIWTYELYYNVAK